jgi:hypothetical protein
MGIKSLRRTGSCRFLIALLALACWPGDAARQDDSTAVPENGYFDSSGDRGDSERGFRESNASCLPLVPVASPNAFGDGTDRAEVASALDSLAKHAALVEEHPGEHDAQVRFLARSLAHDSRDLRRFYTQGDCERATYLLQRITENCVVCQTRILSADDSPLEERFVDAGVLIETSSGEPRAKLLMATHRFDDALDTLEDLLASQEDSAMLLGPLTDYLVVSVRAKGDYERALSGLRRFAATPDLWERLRLDVDGWIAALPKLRDRARGEPDLATARALMEEGHAMTALSEGHAALAHFVVASSILQRLVAEADSQDRNLAEAYYLLGVTEARIGRNYWVTCALPSDPMEGQQEVVRDPGSSVTSAGNQRRGRPSPLSADSIFVVRTSPSLG